MQILDNFIIIALHIICFYAGMKISDRYHEKEQSRIDYEVRLATARQKANDYGVYVAPEKRRRKQPIGQLFMDRLQDYGQATQQINSDKPVA